MRLCPIAGKRGLFPISQRIRDCVAAVIAATLIAIPSVQPSRERHLNNESSRAQRIGRDNSPAGTYKSRSIDQFPPVCAVHSQRIIFMIDACHLVYNANTFTLTAMATIAQSSMHFHAGCGRVPDHHLQRRPCFLAYMEIVVCPPSLRILGRWHENVSPASVTSVLIGIGP